MRIPIPDRTGAAAEIFTLAAELGVNIASFEVVHLAESNLGVAVVLVDADAADLYRGGLSPGGFRPGRLAAVVSAADRAAAAARSTRRRRRCPGSKSIANRALVCAALADGESRLTNVPDGDDTVAMLRCLAGARRRRRRRGRRRRPGGRHRRALPPGGDGSTPGSPARRRGSSPPSPPSPTGP